MLAPAVYLLCAITSLFCTVLLLMTYRRERQALLFWSTACFVGLTLNNILLFLDLVVFLDFDLRVPRDLTSLAAVSVLLYGFIWEADQQ